MRSRGILPIAYSSLAPLANWREGYTAFEGSKATQQAKAAAAASSIAAIAARVGVSEARLLLRYALQRGWPILPKSCRPLRIRENYDVLSFEIPAAEMSELDSLDEDSPFAFAGPGGTRLDPSKVP